MAQLTPEMEAAVLQVRPRSHQGQPGDTRTFEPKQADEGPRERLRAGAQGLTFGGADEAEAWLRSNIGGEDYDTALADVRGKLADYREARPWEALGYEAGGATLPAIAATLLSGGTAAPASTARVLPFLAKLAAVGAGEGALYSFLSATGGEGETIPEQVWNRAKATPGGVTAGVIGAGAGYAVSKAAGAGAGRFMEYVRRRLGDRASRRVERELTRVMQDNNLSMDDVLRRIDEGEILAEMTPEMADVARGYRAQSRAAATVLGDTYRPPNGTPGRSDLLRRETMEYVQEHMGGGADENVMRNFNATDDAMRKAEGAEYTRVFQEAGEVGEDVAQELQEALARVPRAGDDIQKIYRAQTGKTPFFKIDADGVVTFNRAPTLEDAEIVRRGIKAATDAEYTRGAGGVGGAYQGVERGLRSTLDGASDDLASTRARWAAIETARDAFEAGQRALTKSPDEAIIAFERAVDKSENAANAFRQGVLHTLRRRASTGSRKSLPGNIADEEHGIGQVLRAVFPEDKLPGLMRIANRAGASHSASGKIMSGSQTNITQGRRAEMGASILPRAIDAMTGGTSELIRTAGQALKSVRPDLTPQEVVQLAKLMVETNPNVVRRAMTDTTATQQLMALGQAMAERAAMPGAAATAGMVQPGVNWLRQ